MTTRRVWRISGLGITKSTHHVRTPNARCPPWQPPVIHGSAWTCGHRGAKTKTIVSAGSLPQGKLPPLPPEDDEHGSEKMYPPVLQQHLNNIRKFKDCIILTRVGDFYEMYFDQVEQFAPLVNLKKAKRVTVLGDVPMAGFQYTQLDRYLKMFVQDLGKHVAISEQIRIPEHERSLKAGGPQYYRKVQRVVTPGTLIDETFVDPFENNYLLAVHIEDMASRLPKDGLSPDFDPPSTQDTKVGLSWVDLSSGDFFTQVSDLMTLSSLVARIGPKEIVLDVSLQDLPETSIQKLVGGGAFSTHFHYVRSAASSVVDWSSMVGRPITEAEAMAFTDLELAAGNLVLDYVRDKIQDLEISLQPPTRRSSDDCMAIDKQSLRNLEIRSTLRDGFFKGSLLHAIRETVTKSGARLLSQRIVSPSTSLSIINSRLDLVQQILHNEALREDVTTLLKRTHDTFRLLQKFSIGRGDADDLLGLAKTVQIMQDLATILRDHVAAHGDQPLDNENTLSPVSVMSLSDLVGRLDLDGPIKMASDIQGAIDEEGLNQQILAEQAMDVDTQHTAEAVMQASEAGERPPRLPRRTARVQSSITAVDSKPEEIWIMRRSASSALKRAHEHLDSLLRERAELANDLRARLKADSLTLRWTAQLGHFCHVKGRDVRAAITDIEGARIITALKSTRSFYYTEWTHLGSKIDKAKVAIRDEEEHEFRKLRNQALENLTKLRRNAAVLDELDVACSSAIVAKRSNLIRPILHDGTSHRIIGGRHPTVDVGLKEQGRQFTSNDCSVGDSEKIYLITGPNMAGKSTYLRQNALITILAQTGCFVPADYAEIGVVDQIFSRVGSADSLYQDQSTFMVEMLETADILRRATPRSFVIMDEVGRGTTPEDGIAVGYACLHHLQNVNRCRALFATHFHALADMTRDFEDLACYCTDVAESSDGSWSYLHRLRRGVNRDSHALKVARLAGLPESAIQVAGEVLAGLHKANTDDRSEAEGRSGEPTRRAMSARG